MLVLSRKNREGVVVGGATGFERVFKVTVVEINRQSVKLGFEVDPDIPVHRSELWQQMRTSSSPLNEASELAPPGV